MTASMTEAMNLAPRDVPAHGLAETCGKPRSHNAKHCRQCEALDCLPGSKARTTRPTTKPRSR